MCLKSWAVSNQDSNLFIVVMPDGVVGIAILSLLTGAALNSMASGLVSYTNTAAFLVSGAWGAPGSLSSEIV